MADIPTRVDVDAVIIGGGIAGMWTLARLRAEGYNAILLEDEALGAGQTRYAQGIIHGGTKYALTGKLTASSEAVSNMPLIWRACHAGNGELDLSDAVMISDAHYLWSTANLASKITGFFCQPGDAGAHHGVKAGTAPGNFPAQEFQGQHLSS